MKKLLLILTVCHFFLILNYNFSRAQGYKNKIEISVAGAFQTHIYDGGTLEYLNLLLRGGVFLTQHLEAEAEGIITGSDFGHGHVFSGNVAYNFKTARGTLPFVLAGYGVSNSEPFANSFTLGGDADIIIGVLNLGAGLKAPIGTKSALRVEYRFQNFTSQELSNDFQIHTLQFGLSIFLP